MIMMVCNRFFFILMIAYNLFCSCQWWLLRCFNFIDAL